MIHKQTTQYNHAINKYECFVSIITVCYNAESTIERTIDSILNQSFTNYEYVIVDGKSCDRTLEIVNSYSDLFKKRGVRVTIISEKDNGVYDAMNKGCQLSNGEWITYMNADDSYHTDSALEEVFNSNIDYRECGIIYGNTKFCSENSLGEIRVGKKIESILKHLPFCPQAAFVRRSVQLKFPFNIKYKISADYDSFLRMYLNDEKFVHVDVVVADFYDGGISNSNIWETYKEDISVKDSNCVLNKYSVIQSIKYIVFYLRNLSM